MALNGLLDVEISVPDPEALSAFWTRRGLTDDSSGGLGAADRPVQLRFTDGAYRHLSELHLGCDAEEDLAVIRDRLAGLGVSAAISGTTLRGADPVFDHEIVIDVVEPAPLTPPQQRAMNRPGVVARRDVRAEPVSESAPRAPRRVGHIVLGTPDVDRAVSVLVDGLGFKISDRVGGGIASFLRCSTDHHNVMVMPGLTSYLNHYAFEMDDIDAVGKAGQAVLDERADANVVGVGRHLIGANVFWYLLDPSGTMFELYTDMDQILDDELWERDHRRDDWGGDLAVWGPSEPEIFYNPSDIEEIAAARDAAGR